MSESDFVMLESEDGYTFVVPRKVACASGTLRSMLDEDGELSRSDTLDSKWKQDLLDPRVIIDADPQPHSKKPRTRAVKFSNG